MAVMTTITDAPLEMPSQEVRVHNISHRKQLGAFYTPISVSNLLSEWGIRTPLDLVLEPCFGGCTFIEAATERLRDLGSVSPGKNLFGCDIDPLAFSYLNERIKPTRIAGHFFEQDFMTFSPAQLKSRKIDLVIGNPPYIRYSNFPPKQRSELDSWLKERSIKLHGRANLWAYFLLHALDFIADGGRLALVLPGSFLYADYADFIREHIRIRFRKVIAISLVERLFVSEGTEETTVILLAEGFGQSPMSEKIDTACMEGVEEFCRFIKNSDVRENLPNHGYPGYGRLPIEVSEIYHRLASTAGMSSLDKIAKLRIGLVTGDSKFFIKSRSDWQELKIDRRHLKYILPRSQFVKGISIDEDCVTEHIQSNVRCLALSIPSAPRAESVVNYLKTFPTEARERNVTFKKRNVWHNFYDDWKSADAFFIFMTDQGPRIILNSAGAAATNSVYRIFFNNDIADWQMKLAAISMQTTFAQLGAEIFGHPRGAGALKLEPSSASSLKLYMPPNRLVANIESTFNRIDSKLREMDAIGAREIADAFLFSEAELASTLPVLETGLKILRRRRLR